MPNVAVKGIPRVGALKESAHRIIMLGNELWMPGYYEIDASQSRDPGNPDEVTTLRAGLLMGLITANKKYAPAIMGVTTNAEAAASTSIEASAAVVTELARREGASGTFVLRGPPTAAGTVAEETVTYSAATGTTITVTAITNAYIAGSFIMPNDGSDVLKSFLPDNWPVNVTDTAGANEDQQYPLLPIGGLVDASQILPVWPTDTSLQSDIKTRLNDVGAYQFQEDFQ